MPVEIHRDDDPFATGSHDGANGSSILRNIGADFKSCGVTTGRLIKNTTDGSEGEITEVMEDEISVTLTGGTNNLWNRGDEYEIYITDTYNSVISRIYVDKSHGFKASDKKELDRGWFHEDVDLDRDIKHVFGLGQPEGK